ncbi:mitochondrial inner membrane protease ATP23 [Paenibacillus alkaliterrae]|uniref:mitochondrial inner membrane protease ATP23 n=1 Tax=Paenibacillus alkaliterrae TaxID=320909 RepID=UPI001F390EE5|nr:mitochondrial inner membrane protease ATP23 [Paenibacillus alkaliterrae]MCF2940120.1 mitochondrial inner membrane protease ATP23 [Paenibacillus alkaliterrae]
MDFSLVGDITVEISSAQVSIKYNQCIKNAIEYFSKEIGLPIEKIKVHIVMSRDYITDVKKRHFNPSEKENGNTNGIFIPTNFQNEETRRIGKPIIVVNLTKLEGIGVSVTTIESVIVHELIHYFDYCITYPTEIVGKYGEAVEAPYETKEYYIYAYFQQRSEFRAKYFQEKYMIVGLNITEDYMSKRFTHIDTSTNSSLNYTLSHARAQLEVWKSNPVTNQAAMEYVEMKGLEIEEIENKNRIKNIAQLTDLNDFFDFCETSIKVE